MAYFDKVSNIEYLQYESNPFAGELITIKNIFARIKVIDDVKPGSTILQDYFIKEGDRPDTISFDFYDDPGFDWVILLINNITNYYSQWPMATGALQSYVNSKYANPGAIHHFESIQQVFNNAIILKGGVQVPRNFRFTQPDGTILQLNESRRPVSNFEYETRLNEKKKEILILKPDLLDIFVEIVEEENKFTPSTEFINENLKRSEN